MTMNGNKQLVDEWILQILFGLKFCICTRITRRKYRYAFTICITTYKTKNEQEIWFLFSPRCFSHYEDGLCNQWLVITQFFIHVLISREYMHLSHTYSYPRRIMKHVQSLSIIITNLRNNALRKQWKNWKSTKTGTTICQFQASMQF